jgi:hypothetical protein
MAVARTDGAQNGQDRMGRKQQLTRVDEFEWGKWYSRTTVGVHTINSNRHKNTGGWSNQLSLHNSTSRTVSVHET